MKHRVCHSSGQSMLETTLLLVGVVAALVLFFSFIRASVASRIKTGSDTFGHGLLYETDCSQANSRCPFGDN